LPRKGGRIIRPLFAFLEKTMIEIPAARIRVPGPNDQSA
jgi:hypothetical protein